MFSMFSLRRRRRPVVVTLVLGLVLAACAGAADDAATDAAASPQDEVSEDALVSDDDTNDETTDGEASAETVTVTDTAAQTLEIDLPVERVAILDSGTADVLRALGVLDRLVGNHQAVVEDSFFAEIADVPAVATHSEISFEALAEAQPDLVISSTRAHGVVTDNEILAGLDIVDLKLSLRQPELMKQEVALLGQIFQVEERAQELIDFYDRWETEIAQRLEGVTDEERPRVFVEYHAGDYATGGPGSRFYEQVVLAGGNNLSVDIDGEVQVDPEWVAEQDPDVILREVSASTLGYDVTSTDEAEQVRDEIMSRPVIDATTAVRNGAVYLVPTNIYSRPAYIIGVLYLAKWLYPDRFDDLDPDEIHREYVETFHPGIEHQGIWAYPTDRS